MFEGREALGEVVTSVRRATPRADELPRLTDDDLLLLAAQAEELGRAADALRLSVAGEVADRSRVELGEERLSRRRGCASPAEMLERLTMVSGATARERMRTATCLRPRSSLTGEVLPAAFPKIAAALAAGDIGVDAVTAIVKALAPIQTRVGVGHTDAAETELVEAALGSDIHLPSSADELGIMAQTWALYLDPDGTLPEEERAMRSRALRKGRKDANGVIPWRGNLLPETSAMLEALIDAQNGTNTVDSGAPRFTDSDATPKEPSDTRTSGQRNHDALAAILARAAAAPSSPTAGGAAPTLVVTVQADQLARANGIAFVPTRDADDTGAVSASVARHVACIGRVQRIIFGEDGRIVELGASERLFTGHRRRAIATRDGECIIPGCHVPAMWCEVHHVLEHTRGGPTHVDNGVLLCWWHHRTIETSGWEIRMIDGVPWVRAPRWIDSSRTWRPSRGGPVRRLAALAGAAPPGAPPG